MHLKPSRYNVSTNDKGGGMMLLNGYMEKERELSEICSLLAVSWEDATTLHKQMQSKVKEYPINWNTAFYMAVSLMSLGDWTLERWEQCLNSPTYFNVWKASKRPNF